MSQPLWLQIAAKELGVAEYAIGSNPRIIQYDTCTSLKATDDSVAWCSAFINWCMAKSSIKGTNSAAARSWLDWGTVLDAPVEGCVVVLKRGAPPSGHVGLFVKYYDNDTVIILAGNQSDSVKYSHYPKSDVLGYRWPVSA